MSPRERTWFLGFVVVAVLLLVREAWLKVADGRSPLPDLILIVPGIVVIVLVLWRKV